MAVFLLFVDGSEDCSLLLLRLLFWLLSCQVFTVCLQFSTHLFFKVPSTTARWQEKVREWNELWNFPHCVGAIDGKHVVIEAPSNSNSDYYNYKDQFSIVLLAIVDASYNVI